MIEPAAPVRDDDGPEGRVPVLPSGLPGIVGVEEIGAWLGIGTRGARALLARGELPSFKLGKRIYCRLADLEGSLAVKVTETARRKDRSAVAARLAAGLPARAPRGARGPVRPIAG